jgi:8-hydroxy-5-deazaflavin:NADPH oxidoreductase
MNIGIIGAGKIGATAAMLFVNAGNPVAISNSRGPESLAALIQDIGPAAKATNVEEAAAFGDLVLLAIPLGRYESLPAEALAGKIVNDAMNYYSGRDGSIDFGGRTSSEAVAQYLAGARLVKAFNTMHWEALRTSGKLLPDEQLVLFLAGDDAEAKAVVSRLIQEIGFAALDTGSLGEGGRRQQPGSPIYNKPMTAAQTRALLATG